MAGPAELSLKRSRSPSESTDKPSNKRPNNKSSPGSTPSSPVKSDEPDDDITSAFKNGDDLQPQPEPETDITMRDDTAAKKDDAPAATTPATPASQIHMRCLIVTQDASIIIGKGGVHVNEIRDKSGARVMVSESIPGNPERILNVSGALDAVSKVLPIPAQLFPPNSPLCKGLRSHRPEDKRRAIRCSFRPR